MIRRFSWIFGEFGQALAKDCQFRDEKVGPLKPLPYPERVLVACPSLGEVATGLCHRSELVMPHQQVALGLSVAGRGFGQRRDNCKGLLEQGACPPDVSEFVKHFPDATQAHAEVAARLCVGGSKSTQYADLNNFITMKGQPLRSTSMQHT